MWRDYTLFVKLTEKVFDYMNRYCISKLKKVSTTEKCFYDFKTEVFWPNKNKLVTCVINLLQRQLDAEEIREDLRTCIKLFVDFCIKKPRIVKTPEGRLDWTGDKDMTLYSNFFEKRVLDTITCDFDR